ncbi:pentapeptide repeat-containing protein [Kamptonema formosum]|uniref:pentapeptide repeat-containing protein n=1 Tax=Kamptonema formosum TaxID=331992 RepID=UPI00034976BC|nr:pentapeptide repeat-containing protein [Oscillatoria sp. PCC 10802]
MATLKNSLLILLRRPQASAPAGEPVGWAKAQLLSGGFSPTAFRGAGRNRGIGGSIEAAAGAVAIPFTIAAYFAHPLENPVRLKILAIFTLLASLLLGTAAEAENPQHVRRLLNTKQCRGCNLSGANLRQADLKDADLRDAYLAGADLQGADLSKALLVRADLRNANLSGATLTGADLKESALNNANLTGADLKQTRMSFATLVQANLRQADLRGAYLIRANLREANLTGVDLTSVILTRATMPDGTIHKDKD